MKLQKVTHASHKLLLRESFTYRKHLKVSNFWVFFGWNIPIEIRRSIFDKPVLCPN